MTICVVYAVIRFRETKTRTVVIMGWGKEDEAFLICLVSSEWIKWETSRRTEWSRTRSDLMFHQEPS